MTRPYDKDKIKTKIVEAGRLYCRRCRRQTKHLRDYRTGVSWCAVCNTQR